MSSQGEGSTEDDLLVVPSDPANVRTTSDSQEIVELSSEQDQALPVTDVELSGTEEDTETSVVEFDPKYRKAFEGLLFLGKVQKSFKWAGHTFVIKSPTIDVMLEAGQLHQPYVGTVGDIKAWQSLMVAATLVSVDGQSLPVPINDTVTELENKFQYINRHWYPWTLDALYERYILLDAEVAEVIEALGKV